MRSAYRLLLLALAGGLCAPASEQDPPHPALRYGAPDTGQLIAREGYALRYDGRLRSARWVAERITPESLKEEVERKDEVGLDWTVAFGFRSSL